MAKPKIENKEQAILEAALNIFAERGFWNTPTSLISKTAGVADGTLFTYFKTKDDLIQALYLDIKHEVADKIMSHLGGYESVQDKLRHIWTGYVAWGVAHPIKFKVLNQIHVSYQLSETVKAQANEPFIELERMAVESVSRGLVRDYPMEYVGHLMSNTITATVEFMAQHPGSSVDYAAIGFDIFWNGIKR